MLEPREADIPLLFLVLVVLPLVVYVWLGKWAEAAKRRERISLLAQRAVEETVRAESMAVTDAADPVTLKPSAKNIRYDSLNNRSFEEQFTPSTKNSWYDSLNNQSIEDQFIPSAKNSRFDSLNNRNFEEQFTPSAKNSRYDSLNNQSIKDQFIPSAKNSQFDSLNNRSLEDQFTPSAKNFRYDSLSNRSCEDQFKVKNSVAPVGGHVCARCFSPASTRCSRCKSVRYCSGKCQIIHWRQVHKHDCREVETTSSCSSPMYGSMEAFPGHAPVNDNLNSMHFGHVNKQDSMDNAPPGSLSHSSAGTASSNCAGADVSHDTTPRRKSIDKRSRKPNRDTMRRSDPTVLDSVGDPSKGRSKNVTPSNDATVGDAESQEITSIKPITHKHVRQQDNMFETGIIYGPSSSLHLGQNGTSSLENGGDFAPSSGNLSNMENCAIGETMDWNHSYEATVTKESIKVKSATNHSAVKNSKSSKPVVEASGEELYSKKEEKCWVADASKVDERRDTVAASGSNGVSSLGILKMMCLRKSTKVAREDSTKQRGMHKRKQMLFPYDEFMKIFTCELATNLSPRGLINCGNSCYANAVLQCLMCTKPLIVFLLHRSHSRTCCGKDWCLMCELEQLVASLREDEGPLSPSRILHHMQNINCQIGDGSQEDAHEFLRLLVASMQLICLEGLGGENNVDPKLQETTFIQHTFGGRLRSKVKCLRCHHESERYESIMDLTLEIFGWVESLEDALTQFTTPEELNGENMYRCGRCAAYVHARKQLSIHEAPNILTIVLKRFQEGQYGKINKCISFPDMLDMVPFMTGTGDIPPLYILYAVVVHLDTLNASFSGHYVAYVKDAQGTWLRIDDSEVQPVQPSQVMSEGAYMLFYIRSFPRPEGAFCKKSMKQQARPSTTQTQKPSKQGHSRTRSHFVTAEPSSDPNADNGTDFVSHHDSFSRMTANRHIAEMTEFSDATSSDWSVFTSSDDASFTTDSTRDSFSTVDYADMCNGDTFSSIFNNLYPPSSPQNTICRTRFSSSKPQTRFISQERGCVLDSYLSNQPPYRVCKQHNHSEVTDDSPVKDGSNSYHSMSVKDGSNRKSSVDLTSSHHKL